MEYLISTPISNRAIEQIKTYIEDTNIQVDVIRIYIDLQNITIGKYYDENVKNIYYKYDEAMLVQKIYYELINFLAQKVLLFKTLGYNNVFFYMYSDEKRNKLNEYFIPTWKEDRRKSYEISLQKDKGLAEARNWISVVFKSSLKSIMKLVNTSPHCKLCLLKYLDSDFFPYIYILLDEIYQTKNVLHIIVSNDHDYIHVVESNNNVIRYFFLTRVDKTGIIDHKYNMFERLKKKYGKLKVMQDSHNLKILSRYYQIFHALVGDPGDSFKPIIPRKSLDYWMKLLSNSEWLYDLNIDIYELRKRILEKKFNPDLLQDNDNLEIFIKRFLVVDFYFFSLWIVKELLSEGYLPDKHKYLYGLSYKYLNMEMREIIKMNSEIIKPLLFSNGNYLSRNEAIKVLEHFGVKKSEEFGNILWY